MENVGKSADQKQELKKGFYTGGAEDLLPRHHIDEEDFRRKCLITQVQNRVPTGTGKPGKMGRHFRFREKSGNFDQTGNVGENYT